MQFDETEKLRNFSELFFLLKECSTENWMVNQASNPLLMMMVFNSLQLIQITLFETLLQMDLNKYSQFCSVGKFLCHSKLQFEFKYQIIRSRWRREFSELNKLLRSLNGFFEARINRLLVIRWSVAKNLTVAMTSSLNAPRRQPLPWNDAVFDICERLFTVTFIMCTFTQRSWINTF